jgi:hypothetical protein
MSVKIFEVLNFKMKLREIICANSILYVFWFSMFVLMKYNKGFIVNKTRSVTLFLDRSLGCPSFYRRSDTGELLWKLLHFALSYRYFLSLKIIKLLKLKTPYELNNFYHWKDKATQASDYVLNKMILSAFEVDYDRIIFSAALEVSKINTGFHFLK